jgi:hypothetical protein
MAIDEIFLENDPYPGKQEIMERVSKELDRSTNYTIHVNDSVRYDPYKNAWVPLLEIRIFADTEVKND